MTFLAKLLLVCQWLNENDIKDETILDDQFTVKSLMVLVVTATDICRVGGRCAAPVGSS